MQRILISFYALSIRLGCAESSLKIYQIIGPTSTRSGSLKPPAAPEVANNERDERGERFEGHSPHG
jgi:hypothetical protein